MLNNSFAYKFTNNAHTRSHACSGLGHVESHEMDEGEETICLLEKQVELLQKSQCCIRYSGQKQVRKSKQFLSGAVENIDFMITINKPSRI